MAVGSLGTAPGMTGKDIAKIRLDRLGRRIEEVGSGNDDDIPSGRQRFVVPEKLSNQSFSPISLDRSPEATGGDDTEPTLGKTVGEKQRRHVPSSGARPPLMNALEFRSVSKPLVGAK